MVTAELMLDNMEKVKEFAALAGSKDYDIDLISGKYVVNGKSIMGIFSLDLTKPVTMAAQTEDSTLLLELGKFLEEQ